MADARLDDFTAWTSSECRHDEGWGRRWTGGSYCLGCGLPFGVIERQALRGAALLLDAADAYPEDGPWLDREFGKDAPRG